MTNRGKLALALSILLLPPTALWLILWAVDLMPSASVYATLAMVFGAYAAWAAFLAGLAQLSGYSFKDWLAQGTAGGPADDLPRPAPRADVTAPQQGRDLSVIRGFLLSAFDADELDDLFTFAATSELQAARDEYSSSDGLPARVRKAIAFCQRRGLIPHLLDEIERKRPQQYGDLRAELRGAAALVLGLPADLADFTGREAEIARIRRQLNQKGTVAISGIHGMGGIGKTALAVHLAHQLIAEGRFRDAQLYLDLKGTEPVPVEPTSALESLLNALVGANPSRPGDVDALAALWRRAIEGKDALLILDNAAGAAQVRPLLPGCTSCAVLITSRQRFALPGAARLDLRRMDRAEAQEFLRGLVDRLDVGEADTIAELCGDLPLALRVAGNHLDLNDDVPGSDYARMLADEKTRLSRLRDPDQPDLDVAAAISLSVAQLDADLSRAWALLALFPAPFDLIAAVALWEGMDVEGARDRLQSLRNRSLVSYDGELGRYLQHDLVRLAAASELEIAGGGEVEAAHLRLARHYEWVTRAAKELYKQGGEGVLQGLALFDREWPHIQAGQAWAAARSDEDENAARLCSAYPDAAAYLLDIRLHAREHISWLEAAAHAARRLGKRAAEGVHVGYLGIAYKNLGETDKAIEHYQLALGIAREIGDRRNESAHLGNLGWAYATLGEMEQAIEHHTAALEIARQIGDRRGEANHLGNLGLAYKDLGQMEEAVDHYQLALEIARQIGDRRGEAYHLGNLGVAYAKLGRMRRAVDHYQQALEIARQIGDRYNEGNQLGNLGNSFRGLGELDKAIDHYSASLQIAREIGDRRSEGNQLANLGRAYRDKGDTARARELLTESLDIYETIHDPAAERVREWLARLL